MTTNEELRRLAESATPTPLTYIHCPEFERGRFYWRIHRTNRDELPQDIYNIVAETMSVADAAYIVAACNEVPRLLNDALLSKAERDGVVSQLLDVQQDCIALRKQLAAKDLEREAMIRARYDLAKLNADNIARIVAKLETAQKDATVVATPPAIGDPARADFPPAVLRLRAQLAAKDRRIEALREALVRACTVSQKSQRTFWTPEMCLDQINFSANKSLKADDRAAKEGE